jgi:hypothetical protein
MGTVWNIAADPLTAQEPGRPGQPNEADFIFGSPPLQVGRLYSPPGDGRTFREGGPSRRLNGTTREETMRGIFRGLMASGALVLLLGLASGQEGESKVDLNKVPKAVKAAIKARFPDAKINNASTEKDGDKTVYELAIVNKGQKIDVTLTPEGQIVTMEKEIALKDLPKAVAATLHSKYPKADLKIIEEVWHVKGKQEKLEYYEFLLTTAAKKTVEVEIAPDGKFLKEVDKSAKPAEGKKEAAKKSTQQAGGWQTDFPVKKDDLAHTGRNPYFILEPGYYLILEKGAEQHTVTVLNETKTVDGVETRVVEEKELKNGKPVEISMNYYVISKSSGDVYYFGEHVDHYKGGKVVGHDGSWLSGVNGAKFGLMMPGKVRLKMKYYHEQAPGAGMDRAEIVSLSETVTTPVGTFKDCIKTEETTPLEKDTKDYKYYAPGVGLVKENDLTLVKFGYRGKLKTEQAPSKVRVESGTVLPAAAALVQRRAEAVLTAK